MRKWPDGNTVQSKEQGEKIEWKIINIRRERSSGEGNKNERQRGW